MLDNILNTGDRDIDKTDKLLALNTFQIEDIIKYEQKDNFRL